MTIRLIVMFILALGKNAFPSAGAQEWSEERASSYGWFFPLKADGFDQQKMTDEALDTGERVPSLLGDEGLIELDLPEFDLPDRFWCENSFAQGDPGKREASVSYFQGEYEGAALEAPHPVAGILLEPWQQNGLPFLGFSHGWQGIYSMPYSGLREGMGICPVCPLSQTSFAAESTPLRAGERGNPGAEETDKMTLPLSSLEKRTSASETEEDQSAEQSLVEYKTPQGKILNKKEIFMALFLQNMEEGDKNAWREVVLNLYTWGGIEKIKKLETQDSVIIEFVHWLNGLKALPKKTHAFSRLVRRAGFDKCEDPVAEVIDPNILSLFDGKEPTNPDHKRKLETSRQLRKNKILLRQKQKEDALKVLKGRSLKQKALRTIGKIERAGTRAMTQYMQVVGFFLDVNKCPRELRRTRKFRYKQAVVEKTLDAFYTALIEKMDSSLPEVEQTKALDSIIEEMEKFV